VDTANAGVTSKILSVSYDYTKAWSGLSPAQASLDALNGVTAKEWEALAPLRADAVNDDFTPPETKNAAPSLVAPETAKHFHFVGKDLVQDEATGAYTLVLLFSDDESHKKEFYFQFTDKDRGLVKTKALYDATDADVQGDAFIVDVLTNKTTYNNSFNGGRDPNTGLINIEVTSHPHKNSTTNYNYTGYSFSGDMDIRGVLRTVTVTVTYKATQSGAAGDVNGSEWPSYGSHKAGVQEVVKGALFEATKITLD
jgi:hypothetical protein